MTPQRHSGSATAPGRLGQLDDLRAFAAGLVFLCHAGVAVVALNGLTQGADLYVVGRVGVAVFFFISGYVIYRPFVARRPDLWRYGVRRVVRIVPAYWVALACFIWVLPFAFSAATSVSLIGSLRLFGFAQIYSTATMSQGLGPAWTLCVEMTFYAAVPAFAALMHTLGPRRRRLEPWAIVLLVLLSIIARVIWPHGVVGITLLGYLGWFAPGMLLAVVPRERWSTLRLPTAASWALAGVLFLVIAPNVVGPTAPALQGTMLQYVGFGLVASLIAMPVFCARRGTSRVGGWLGERSYGIYLWHIPVLTALTTAGLGTDPLAFMLAAMAVTVVVAHVSFTRLERPLMTAAARGRGARAPAATPPAPVPA